MLSLIVCVVNRKPHLPKSSDPDLHHWYHVHLDGSGWQAKDHYKMKLSAMARGWWPPKGLAPFFLFDLFIHLQHYIFFEITETHHSRSHGQTLWTLYRLISHFSNHDLQNTQLSCSSMQNVKWFILWVDIIVLAARKLEVAPNIKTIYRIQTQALITVAPVERERLGLGQQWATAGLF